MTRKKALTWPHSARQPVLPPPDCFICTKLDPSADDGLEITQVIASYAFCMPRSEIRIWADMIVRRGPGRAGRFRVFHPGYVEAQLHRFSMDLPDLRQQLINKLYADRIKRAPGNPDTVLFRRRLDAIGLDYSALRVSLDGPGGCFRHGPQYISLKPELEDATGRPAFSSYVIPPEDLQPIQPGETSIFRLQLVLAADSYGRFVGGRRHFAIESHARIMAHIDLYELATLDERLATLYKTKVRPGAAAITPNAYDIIIFQDVPGASRMTPELGAMGVLPLPLPDPALVTKLLWFYGRDDFWLELSDEPSHASEGNVARAEGG